MLKQTTGEVPASFSTPKDWLKFNDMLRKTFRGGKNLATSGNDAANSKKPAQTEHCLLASRRTGGFQGTDDLRGTGNGEWGLGDSGPGTSGKENSDGAEWRKLSFRSIRTLTAQ